MAWPYLYAQNSDPSPWTALRRLQEEMNEWFEGGPFATTSAFPAVNVWGDGDKLVAAMELPGLEAGDVDLSINGKSLTVSGERKVPADSSDLTVHRNERLAGKFTRTLELPYRIDSGAVEARFKDGMLTITLPRLPEEKPKKIAIS